MKASLAILITLCLASELPAQEKPLQQDELIQSVEQWMRENLDDSVLLALGQIDRNRVSEFFTELHQQFEGSSVYDLGALKETASRLLPVLQQFDETRPYAVWLQTHFDYLDTAD